MSDKPEDAEKPVTGKQTRRDWMKVAGGTVAGLAIGGALGYVGATALKGSGSGNATTQTTTNGGAPPFWGEPQSITVMTLSNKNTSDILNFAATQYAATHPGVTVNQQLIAEATMNASVISALPSSPPPDAFYNSTLPAFNAQAVNTGDALILDPWVKNYGWDTATNAWNTYLVNGHSYWFYYSFIYFGNIYYNADLFKKLNITVPADISQNPTELYSIAAQLKQNSLLPLVHGYNTQPEWFLNTFSDWAMNALTDTQYQQLSTAYGTDLFTPNFANRAVKLNDSNLAPIWQMVADWRDKLYTQDITTQTDQTAVSLFASGKAGMYQVGSWGVGALAAPTTNFNYGFWPLTAPPVNGGPRQKMVIFGSTYFFTSKTKSPNLLADFFNTFLSTNAQAFSLNNEGIYPGVALGPSAIKNPLIAQSVGQSAQLDYRFSLAGSVATQLHDPFESALASILSGQATPTQAAQTLENLAVQLNQTGPPTSASTTAASTSA